MPKTIQILTLGLVLIFLLAANTPAVQAASGVAKIFKSKVYWTMPGKTSITFRAPKDIKIRSWITCDVYNPQKEVVASIYHVLNSRVPTYSFEVAPEDVYFMLCYDFER